MYLDLEPLQGKPWNEQLATLVDSAYRIAQDYQNPMKNDAKGTLDCYQLADKFNDCKKILKRYEKKEQ